jgi:putative acetyltransferase
MEPETIEVTPAVGEAEVAVARQLFIEYVESLNLDLEYQGFTAELTDLPAVYAAPRGCLLLARAGDEIVGCVAVRPLDASTCELKRLFVRPRYRGHGAGRRLVESAIHAARVAGYAEMKLDTLETMTSARRLYTELGFRETSPYNEKHVPGTCFYSLALET